MTTSSNLAKNMVSGIARAVATNGPIPGAPGAQPLVVSPGAVPASPLEIPAAPVNVGPTAIPSAPPNAAAPVIPPSPEPRAFTPGVVPANIDPSNPPPLAPPVAPAAPVAPVAPVAPPPLAPVAPAAPRMSPADVANRFKPVDENASPDITVPDFSTADLEDIPSELPTGPDVKEKTGFAFATLRNKVKAAKELMGQAKTTIESFQTQAATFEAEKTTLVSTSEEQVTKIAELTDRIGKLSLAESPDFQKKYDVQISGLEQKLVQTIAQYTPLEGDGALQEAKRLLLMSPEDLVNATEDYNPLVSATANLIGSDLARIREAKDQELANWKQSSLANQIQGARQDVVAITEQRGEFAKLGLEAAIANGSPVYTSNDPEAQTFVRQLKDAFVGFAKSATEPDIIAAAAEGFSAPFLIEALNERDATIIQLQEQLGLRRNAALPQMHAAPPSVAPPLPQAAQPGVVLATSGVSATEMAKGSTAGLLNNLQHQLTTR